MASKQGAAHGESGEVHLVLSTCHAISGQGLADHSHAISGCHAISGSLLQKADTSLPGKGNSNSHGARPVY